VVLPSKTNTARAYLEFEGCPLCCMYKQMTRKQTPQTKAGKAILA
jgi:hypothetical protein